MSLAQLLNVSLRGLTLLSKFALLVVLARFLTPADVGLYGLFVVTCSYSLYLLGFDFYAYTTREIIKTSPADQGAILKDQFVFAGLLYVVFLPVLLLPFLMGLLPFRLMIFFFPVLALEHIAQEFYRFFVAISKPLTASAVLFLRAGLWGLVLIAMMFYTSEYRDLRTVLVLWALGGLAACTLAAAATYRMKLGGWTRSINWPWIKRGVGIALPFLIATLALRGIYTFDRYWFESIMGIDSLAAYVLFMGIGTSLLAFLDAGVFAFVYPVLIRTWAQRSCAEFRRESARMLMLTLATSSLFCLVAALILPPLLQWLGQPVYMEMQFLFWWIMLANVVFCFSMVPHYALYAQGHDRSIIAANVLSFAVFLSAAWGFSHTGDALAVPYAMVAAFTFMLTWKSLAYVMLTPAGCRILGRSRAQ